jgi:hypothetical protein
MRTVTTTKTLYQFDELSDEAKERARDNYREACSVTDMEFAAEHVIDDAKDVLKVLGYSSVVIQYSGFSYQGNGAQFTGGFCASDYDGKGTNAIQALLLDRPGDEELARCAAELERILKVCPELSACIESHGRDTHEMATRFGIDLGDEDASDEYEDAFIEVSRDLMRWIYKALEAEWDYLNSDAAVDESITANAYEFDEGGNLS